MKSAANKVLIKIVRDTSAVIGFFVLAIVAIYSLKGQGTAFLRLHPAVYVVGIAALVTYLISAIVTMRPK